MTPPPVRPRDFVETGDGLCFAVVSPLHDDGRYLTSLRYHRHQGRLRKLDTSAAAALLQATHPTWLAHSPLVDAVVHLVPHEQVIRIHHPENRLEALREAVQRDRPLDDVSRRAVRAARALEDRGVSPTRLGVTGSLLLDAQTPKSDIDLATYGRAAFALARAALAGAIRDGALAPLSDDHWREAWDRRGRPRSLDEYQWHERRKGTKALLDGTRIDLSLVPDPAEQAPLPAGVRKLGQASVVAPVTDATAAFDHPARYRVAHPDVAEVLSFTPTYAGQAEAGEMLEAAGWLEEDEAGVRRLVVGTSREAAGEWIRVAR